MSSSIARVTARMPAPYQAFNNFAELLRGKTSTSQDLPLAPSGDLGPACLCYGT